MVEILLQYQVRTYLISYIQVTFLNVQLFLKSDLGIKERFHIHTLIGFNYFVVQVIRMGLFLVLQSGNTPLHLAVTRGQLGTVKLLLGYRPIFSIPNLVSSRVCYLIFARVS